MSDDFERLTEAAVRAADRLAQALFVRGYSVRLDIAGADGHGWSLTKEKAQPGSLAAAPPPPDPELVDLDPPPCETPAAPPDPAGSWTLEDDLQLLRGFGLEGLNLDRVAAGLERSSPEVLARWYELVPFEVQSMERTREVIRQLEAGKELRELYEKRQPSGYTEV